MSPNEHYREAERMLALWHGARPGDELDDLQLLAAAQVHATLATLGERQES